MEIAGICLWDTKTFRVSGYSKSDIRSRELIRWTKKICTCRDTMKSMLPRRVRVKYLDRIHSRSCLLLFQSNSFLFFSFMIKEEISKILKKIAEHYRSLTSNGRTLILFNLGKKGSSFLFKYSVFRYYYLSFNIN